MRNKIYAKKQNIKNVKESKQVMFTIGSRVIFQRSTEKSDHKG